MMRTTAGWWLSGMLALFGATAGAAQRVTMSLDGVWRIADSVSATEQPSSFAREVPVPGLANLARPGFPDVDRFDSRQVIDNLIRKKKLPESARVSGIGVPRQERNYFWYERAFTVAERREVARLRIGKAQFGTAVWLNGQPVGEHHGCFTAGIFDVTAAMNWDGENRLLVRIGAHPAVVPLSVPTGTDQEKNKWTPGIYDRVTLELSDNLVIDTVQVAPRIADGAILVQTRLRNFSAGARRAAISHRVVEWKSGRAAGASEPEEIEVEAGGERTITHTIAIEGARLWSPDDPFLYTVETSSGGDAVATRFGLREFRSDPVTKRFYLNGEPIYLRGSNITLHRFFEDPACGARPWDEAWLQRLLVTLPRELHWNSFRFCIGPVPQRWLEIADEAGLLIQHEYFIWTTARPEAFPAEWTEASLVREFSEFMRDAWNHPSVVIWDACNETRAPILGDRIIPAVRGLDLSNRPWDNGYNPPAAPGDPVENHPYEDWRFGDVWKKIPRLEQAKGDGLGPNTPAGHTTIINEYGWLWLNRDGSTTILTEKLYEELAGAGATPAELLETAAYYFGALTEFWRAHRQMAGVQHFVYLTGSYPGVFTSDHFRDVTTLELEPHFAGYMSEAFKPLGVYLNLWRPQLAGSEPHAFDVMLVNDRAQPVDGDLELVLETREGAPLARTTAPFALAPLGAATVKLALDFPAVEGAHRLQAIARPAASWPEASTRSRRNVQIVQP